MVIVDDTIRHEIMMQLGYSSQQCNLCSPKFVVLVCKNFNGRTCFRVLPHGW